MPNLYSSLLLPTTATATTSQVGYTATNALLQSLGYPWRAQNTTAHEYVIDLGSSKTIRGLLVHGCNFTSATISHSDNNVSYTTLGTLTTYANRYARRRGLLAMNVTKRYLKIAFSGTPTDSLSYWWIGSVFVMGAVTAFLAPTYSYEVETLKPGIINKLGNGLSTKANTGLYRDIITMEWDAMDSETVTPVMALPDAGVCVLDMQLANYPDDIWPITTVEEKNPEVFYQPKFSKMRRELMEVC